MTPFSSFYRRQLFFPGWPGLFFNPHYFARKGLATHLKALASHLTGRTLDIGCGRKPYAHLCGSGTYVGLEIGTAATRQGMAADAFYDGHHFPFADGAFDSVLASQVIEHVFDPDSFLDEIYRVTAAGARLLVTAPFVWDEHEQPQDFARYSSFGLRHLVERHGFAVCEQRKSVTDLRAVFQMLNTYIYKQTVTGSRLLNLLSALVFMAPVNLIGEMAGRLLPANPDLYLDNIILARKENPCP